jgi:ribonuclease HI
MTEKVVYATVISDASFYRKVNKKGRTRRIRAGWAAYIRVDEIPKPIKVFGEIKAKKLTSTTCEMYAALNGAWVAKKHGANNILIRSDCMTVVNAIERKNISEELLAFWDHCVEEADLKDVVIKASHVKGHGSINSAATWVNNWCDVHARLAIQLAPRRI